jgi:hypothetical protein
MPCPSSDHLAEILTDLYENRDKLDATAELCYLRSTDEQFDWDTVAAQFRGVFQETLEAVSVEAEEEKPKEKKKKRERREKRPINALT